MLGTVEKITKQVCLKFAMKSFLFSYVVQKNRGKQYYLLTPIISSCSVCNRLSRFFYFNYRQTDIDKFFGLQRHCKSQYYQCDFNQLSCKNARNIARNPTEVKLAGVGQCHAPQDWAGKLFYYLTNRLGITLLQLDKLWLPVQRFVRSS